MAIETMVGLIAASLTTISFLPQVLKIWKTKSAKDVSLETFSIFCAGIFLWLVYGLMIGDLPLIAANVITFVLSLLIVVLKLKYSK